MAPALPVEVNYFESLEIPEKLNVDAKDLSQRFYALSRKWHPDRYARAAADEQQLALDASALLNDAYRTLRDPVARTEYLLSLRGVERGDAKKVPPELLEEVFELNMALEEVRMGDTEAVPQLRQAHTRFQGMLEGADRDLQSLFERWDETGGAALLDLLRARLNHRKYISNLVRDTAAALENHVSD